MLNIKDEKSSDEKESDELLPEEPGEPLLAGFVFWSESFPSCAPLFLLIRPMTPGSSRRSYIRLVWQESPVWSLRSAFWLAVWLSYVHTVSAFLPSWYLVSFILAERSEDFSCRVLCLQYRFCFLYPSDRRDFTLCSLLCKGGSPSSEDPDFHHHCGADSRRILCVPLSCTGEFHSFR